jgi:hypothetical protein
MPWPLRYLWNCVKGGFTQWRIHQAIVGVIAVAGGLVFKDWFSAHKSDIPLYLVCWLVTYILVITPAYLWHQQDDKLQPKMVFDEHEDNNALYENGVYAARATVKNVSAVLLNNVQVKLVSIDPRPSGLVSFQLPLPPMHDRQSEARFSLQPGTHKSVDVVLFDPKIPKAKLCHLISDITNALEPNSYQVKLLVSADETLPAEQCFKVEINSLSSPPLHIRRTNHTKVDN